MACDFLRLANKGVQELSPYVPGKPIDELAREIGLNAADIVKLASNENPLGPSPKVLAAVERELAQLTRYPDGSGHELKQQLAQFYQVQAEQVTLGNGSNDVLELIAKAWLHPGTNAVFSQYAFAVYPIATMAAGAECREVPALDYGHDLEAMLNAIDEQTRVVFIANPNNPTGTWFDLAALESFLERVPGQVLVVLDEAYIEYASGSEMPDGVKYLGRYPNLVVTRTFSKAYGLAALRVGYALSSEQVAEVLNRVRQPFNVNSLALVAAAAALEDEDYLFRSRHANEQGMQQLEEGLEALGLSWITSRGNFIAVDFSEQAAYVNEQLLQHGVIVRPLAGYNMPNFLRVSIGTHEENARFLGVLKQVLVND